jgi:2-hydroxychromene-2-carboxylate isomerase
MTQPVEFFYDFRSPYSYLAYTQLRDMDVTVALKPMMILKVMEKVGNVPTTITCAAKGRYARTDLGRWAKRYGIALNPADMRQTDGDACSRAVLAAKTPQDAATITMALYRALWSEGRTLASKDDISKAIADAGLDAAPIMAAIDAAETTATLDANTNEAAERGVFGSPTIFAGGAMFFGNDRLDFLREHLTEMEKAA